MATNKGFIIDQSGNKLLPITRGELVLDARGTNAFFSDLFAAVAPDAANGIAGHAGLMTAAEKAMLNGSSGQGLSDLYNKLTYINSGLKFGNNVLSFYKSDGTQTPIIITASDPIQIQVQENKVNFSLESLHDSLIERQGVIKNIKIDTYGRVTDVSVGTLTTNDLPALDGVTITNSTFTGCVSSEVPSTETSIVNKKYVDDQIKLMSQVASGSLVFGGTLDNIDDLAAKFVAANINKYYKVTSNITLSYQEALIYLHDVVSATIIKPGDTLILWQESSESDLKFIHIPSGDDLTQISIYNNSSSRLQRAVGEIALNFSNHFDIPQPASNTQYLNVGLRYVGSTDAQGNKYDGILSYSDWEKFNTYSAKSISVTPTITQTTPRSYLIGSISTGDTSVNIYGQRDLYTLSLKENPNSPYYNPILNFIENGVDATNITLQGIKGVEVKKSGNDIQISANLQVHTDSTNYLSVTDGTDADLNKKIFKLNIGNFDQSGQITSGLATTDFVLRSVYAFSTTFEFIDYSLLTTSADDPTDPYRYGNEKLRKAIGGISVSTDTESWTQLII